MESCNPESIEEYNSVKTRSNLEQGKDNALTLNNSDKCSEVSALQSSVISTVTSVSDHFLKESDTSCSAFAPSPSTNGNYSARCDLKVSEYDGTKKFFTTDGEISLLIDKNDDNSEENKKDPLRSNMVKQDSGYSIYIPMPDSLILNTKSRKGEFSQLKYTRVFGDASEFIKKGYVLRVAEMYKKIEVFVVITMFNEDVDMFIKTWDSVVKNIAYLCSKKLHFMWGPSGWEKVAVCVVADGWRHLSPRTLSLLGAIGLYRDGIISSNPDPNISAHMFEVTTQLRLMKAAGTYKTKQAPFPLQSLLFLKEHNYRKINSHRWFFDAFCKSVEPRLCAMLDVGTRIGKCSIYEVWKEFHMNPKVAGVCGELCVDTGIMGSKLFNFLVAAQNFEYNSSNILDKPVESLFGYVNVLPGAFSTYRYEALKFSPGERNPLDRYFTGDPSFVKNNLQKARNLRKANTYLAEDRILGFEVVSNSSKDWILSFVKGAKAYTDVPDTIAELLAQRRRWMNGSFFASLYVISNALDVLKTKHSAFRKVSILGVIVHNTIEMLFCWLQPSNCYIAFYYLSSRVFETTPLSKLRANHTLLSVVNYIYLFSLFIALVTSLSIRPHGSRFMYRACMFVFSTIVLMLIVLLASFMGHEIYMNVCGFFRESLYIIRTKNEGGLLTRDRFKHLATDIELITIVLCFTNVFCCFLYGHISHIVTSFVQYVLILPSRANVLMVYAYCNIHDTTWGTKGLSDLSDDKSHIKFSGLNPDAQIRKCASMTPNDKDHTQACTFLSFLNTRTTNSNSNQTSDLDKIQDDYPLLFRAKVIIPWILSNVIFSIILVKEKLFLPASMDQFGNFKMYYYLVFILWLMVVINFLKALGSIIYHLSLAKSDLIGKMKS